MKKILAGCLAAAMFCGGMAMAEAPGGNSLRDKIDAAGAGQATIELETAPGFMIPEAVDTETGFMVPEAVEEEAAAVPEGVQTRKPGSLMSQIDAVKQGESASVGIIGGADGPTNIYVSLPEEDKAISIIGGQDGPTVTFVTMPEPVAVPEIAENTATEMIPPEEEAPLAFVLRDAITWDSTVDEIEELFEGYEAEVYTSGRYLLPQREVWLADVPVSNYVAYMSLWFDEDDQLWGIEYTLRTDEYDPMLATLIRKYGEAEISTEYFKDLFNPIMEADEQLTDYDLSDRNMCNWFGPQNTLIVLADHPYETVATLLGYYNTDYIAEMQVRVRQANEFFGI